jgi:hypothetical protein
VLTALLILLIGLTPSAFSIWVMRQADARAQARLRLALNAVATRGIAGVRLSSDHQYIEGLGYIIGDLTCRFNARSTYLRCTVNPSGPCQDCSADQPRELEDTQ